MPKCPRRISVVLEINFEFFIARDISNEGIIYKGGYSRMWKYRFNKMFNAG